MNTAFLLAGGLSLLTAAMHGLGGELTIWRKVNAAAFPTMPNGDGAQAKAEARMTWHAITAYFAVTGGLLLLMAGGQVASAQVIGSLTALHFGVWALVLLIVPPLSVGDWRALVRSPQWVLLGVLAALTYGGTLS